MGLIAFSCRVALFPAKESPRNQCRPVLLTSDRIKSVAIDRAFAVNPKRLALSVVRCFLFRFVNDPQVLRRRAPPQLGDGCNAKHRT